MVNFIAADIGGTKCRFRFCTVERDDAKETLVQEKVFKSQEYGHLTDILREFIGTLKVTIDVVACAVCGPVVDGKANLTNLKWLLDSKKMAQDLGVGMVVLINDFGGNALGVTQLTKENCIVFNDVPATPGAPIGIIGAGTGLGEAFLTWGDGVYKAWSSEGGHTDFAPQSDLQMGLVQFVRQRIDKQRWTAKEYQAFRASTDAYTKEERSVALCPSGRENIRVSVERVVSGSAWPHIYDYLRARFPDRIDAKVDAEIRAQKDPAGTIQRFSRAGTHGEADWLCKTACEMFVEMYGAEAGNLALKLFCFGGLFIAGGVAQYISDHMLTNGRFMNALKRKGRLAGNLDHVPVFLIKDECNVGLLGATILARRTLFDMGLVSANPSPPANSIVQEPQASHPKRVAKL